VAPPAADQLNATEDDDSARDEFDEEFYNEEFFVDETQRQLAKRPGEQLGGLARELLASASKTRKSKWPT
jgi:hypothetical protein